MASCSQATTEPAFFICCKLFTGGHQVDIEVTDVEMIVSVSVLAF
jgi:hypothetical protein